MHLIVIKKFETTTFLAEMLICSKFEKPVFCIKPDYSIAIRYLISMIIINFTFYSYFGYSIRKKAYKYELLVYL